MAEWREQSLRLWQNLGKKERYIIAGSALFLFMAIIGWSYWWGGRPDYVPLFTGLDAKDAGEVAAKLKETKIPFEIGNSGTAIMVPSKDVYRIRLDLASQGIPRGNKGFEIFDQNKFGVTEFQNKVYLLQALQGELARTIEQMSEVEKARVHIVLPEDSLYKKNEKPATASIMLKLRPSAQLRKEQVKGIVNLVAHSIQGLKAENITVVDHFARVLNEEPESPHQIGAGTLTQLDLTKKVQDRLQKDAQSLLEQVLGPGKAAVRVSVELNFDQRTVDRQVFEPVVDDKGIIRSSQETTESYKGNSPLPGGPPGTASNIPGYVTPSAGNQSNYDKKEVIRNFEINETREKVIVAPGAIKRITASVLIDANISKIQQDSITKVVSAAIGINATRGDVVFVESIPFSTELFEKQRKEEQAFEEQQKYQYWLKIGAAVIAVLLIVFIIFALFRRRRSETEMELAATLPVPIPLQPEVASEPAKKEMTQQEKELAQQRELIEKLAKSRPEDLSQIIRVWLADE